MESAQFWSIRGNDFFDRQKYDDALLAYRLALKIDPRYANAWLNIGVVMGILNDHNAALKAFEYALKIDPTLDMALRNKGLSLTHLERYHEAIAVFNRALKINPEDGRARYYKGIAYARMGNNRMALPLLTDDMR